MTTLETALEEYKQAFKAWRAMLGWCGAEQWKRRKEARLIRDRIDSAADALWAIRAPRSAVIRAQE